MLFQFDMGTREARPEWCISKCEPRISGDFIKTAQAVFTDELNREHATEENPAMIKGSREMRLPFLLWVFIIFGVIPYENWWFTNLCKYP